MPWPRFAVCMISAGVMVTGADMACALDYPNKAIRIVTTEAGGGADLVTRMVAQGLTAGLGQPVIVENRGGSAIVPAQIVAQAPPDGYTLFLSGSNVWTLPLMQKVPYDPVKDFSPVTLADRAPNILVVNPSVAANSVKDLIALAKARPGGLNYASGGSGTSNHLAAELFKAMAGVNVGVEVVASSPEEFAAAIKSEMAKIGKVIKDAGIRAD